MHALELASLEKKKERENDDFDFFKIRFLGFYRDLYVGMRVVEMF